MYVNVCECILLSQGVMSTAMITSKAFIVQYITCVYSIAFSTQIRIDNFVNKRETQIITLFEVTYITKKRNFIYHHGK